MNVVSSTPSMLPMTEPATFSCTLTNMWTGATHPILYSSVTNSAHWTPPVLAAHSDEYEMWAPSSMASPGVELVAELGRTNVLQNELSAQQGQATVGEVVVGQDQFNNADPPQTFDDITLTAEHNLLSTISMIAPSPDWFSGLYNYSPVDEISGMWLAEFSIETQPFDSGTEQGDTYSISNPPTSPATPIFELTVDTVPDNGILLDPSGTQVLPVATWSCILQNNAPKDEMPSMEDEMEMPSMEEDAPMAACQLAQFGETCDTNSDCCSNNCRANQCRSNSNERADRNGIRISASEGEGLIGGAAGRPRDSLGATGGLRRGRTM